MCAASKAVGLISRGHFGGAMGDASMAAQNADSAYHTAHYFCRAAIRKQPHQGNTSCRAPGNIFSIPAHELVLEHVAALIGARPEAVREANFYQPGDATPGGDVLGGAEGEHNWTVDELWARAKAAGDGWDARRAAVDAFNAANRWRKRGLCLMPTKYGITAQYRITATVQVHADGTVAVTHGGSEIGQGIHTKVAQAVAYVHAPRSPIRGRSRDLRARSPPSGTSSASRSTM